MNRKIRIAELSDAKQLLEIYSPFVQSTPISFEIEPPSLTNFSNRISSSINQFPWLVYEIEGVIVGYAYASQHRSRSAYAWSCDTSVYINKKYTRLGIGKNLYINLFSLLRSQGYFNVFAGITQPNEASVGLHEVLGFIKVGTYQNVGFKFNKWHDVSWHQLKLQSEKIPSTPTPFKEIRDKISLQFF